MRLCFLTCVFLGVSAFGQNIGNIAVSDISHSSATVTWSTGWTNRGQYSSGVTYAPNDMVRYGVAEWLAVASSNGVTPGSDSSKWQQIYARIAAGTTTSMESGAGGEIYGSLAIDLYGTDGQIGGYQANLYGLAPNTTYYICPEMITAGSPWPSSTTACPSPTTFTTTAVPAVHPVYPVSPVTFNTTYPDTTGYNSVTVANDCSDLQSDLNAAAANQPATGTIIKIPVGVFCTGAYTLPADPTVKTISSGATNTSTNLITLTNHGLADQQKIRIGGAPPGRFTLVPGIDYYTHVIDSNTFQLTAAPGGAAIDVSFIGTISSVNTGAGTLTVQSDNQGLADGSAIQFRGNNLPAPLTANTTYYVLNPTKHPNTFQVSTSQGGSAVALTTTGSGTITVCSQSGTWYLMPWTGTSKKIVIRSAAPDSTLPPADVQINPEWASSMAGFKLMQPISTNYGIYPPLSITGSGMAHDYIIGPGIEFTTSDTTSDLNSTVDPGGFQGWIQIVNTNANITLDRVYFTTPNFYVSVGRAIIEYEGADVAVVNSYIEHWNDWIPLYRSPLAQSGQTPGWHLAVQDSTHVTLAPGKITVGPNSASNPGTITVTLSGGGVSACGLAMLNMDMATLRFILPVGASVVSVSGWDTWTQSASGSPAFPTVALYGDQRLGVVPLGQICFSGGSVSGVSDNGEGYRRLGYLFDAVNRVVAGIGPGPYKIANNYWESTGITWHWDDSNSYADYTGNATYFCGPYYPQNILFQRNYVTADKRAILGSQWGDGNRYFHRNHIEAKNGSIFKADGNVMEYSYLDGTGAGGSFNFMARRCGVATDYELSNNTIRHSHTGFVANGGIAQDSPIPHSTRRVWLHNNLVWDVSPIYQVPSGYRPVPSASLLALWLQNGGEDVRIEHNTFDTGGPFNHFSYGFWEGVKFTDNYVNVGDRMITVEGYDNGFSNCDGVNDLTGLNCIVRKGCSPGACSGTDSSNSVPGYTWAGNGFNIWNGIINNLPQAVDTGSKSPQFLNPSAGDYTLKRTSPLLSGAHSSTDGVNIAADIDALNQAQGFTDRQNSVKLSGMHVINITASGALVIADVPDAGAACYVGYGTTLDPTAWARTPVDTSNSRRRSISITGLASGTLYNYQLWCAGTVPTLTRQFRTN